MLHLRGDLQALHLVASSIFDLAVTVQENLADFTDRRIRLREVNQTREEKLLGRRAFFVESLAE